jgi:predicted transcriptional regulator
MANQKLTKREVFETSVSIFARLGAEGIIDAGQAAILVDAYQHELELLDRKRAGSSKLTDTQRENIRIKQDIMHFLNSVDEATATEVCKEMDISVQKASALLNQLVKETKSAQKNVNGKKVTFSTIQ